MRGLLAQWKVEIVLACAVAVAVGFIAVEITAIVAMVQFVSALNASRGR